MHDKQNFTKLSILGETFNKMNVNNDMINRER